MRIAFPGLGRETVGGGFWGVVAAVLVLRRWSEWMALL